ncbi:hypothetical protein CBR_g51437 [Chara braunii]|uniref:Uncharacterized protein n=1 Tax=Chara braunii TaxID=69332 RepID=A0A388K675_CHABU|nr:hypothetical protein CBR_g51437 [Chara braunii]|eukprot:GBG65554.1 hypothetical protein CBR_g51437 [Chara braunii]
MAFDEPGPSGASGDNVFAKGPPAGYFPPQQAQYPPPSAFNAVPASGIPFNPPPPISPGAPMPVATPMPMAAPGYYQCVGYPAAAAVAAGVANANANPLPGSVHLVSLPSASAPRQWSGALCDCCLPAADGSPDGCGLCCLTFWCSCVTFGRTVERAGLAKAAPMSVIYFTATTGLFVFLLVIASILNRDKNGDGEADYTTGGVVLEVLALVFLFLAMGLIGGYYRRAMRKKFMFAGSDGTDCLTHACCCCCVLCQEYRTMASNVTKGVWTGGPVHAVSVVIPPVIQQMRS